MEEKKLVKYDNNFNIANLNELSKIEQDIFMTICSKFSTKKEERIVISYEEIKADADLSIRKYSDTKFKRYMLVTQEKILRINFSVDDGTGIRQRPLFREFYTPHGKQETIAQLDELFLEYLYNIPQKIAFSQFELNNFLELRSKYAKTLMRFLLQNFTGKWTVNWESFREKLGFPNSQKASQCFRTLDGAIKELENTGFITHIKYTTEKARRRGSPIEKITFTYKINKNKQAELEGQTTISDFIPNESERTIDVEPQEVIKVVAEPKKQVESSRDALYDPPVVIEKPKIQPTITGESLFSVQQTQPAACPKCGASVIEKTAKDGKRYHCCANSNRWGMGNKSCSWFEWVEEA